VIERESFLLCALEDVADGGSGGFITETPVGRLSLLVVRRGTDAYVYVNSCPHIGSPLDFEPGKFLNRDKTHIMCSTHGALFEIADGHCVSGPCVGKDLKKIACRIEQGQIRLLFDQPVPAG